MTPKNRGMERGQKVPPGSGGGSVWGWSSVAEIWSKNGLSCVPPLVGQKTGFFGFWAYRIRHVFIGHWGFFDKGPFFDVFWPCFQASLYTTFMTLIIDHLTSLYHIQHTILIYVTYVHPFLTPFWATLWPLYVCMHSISLYDVPLWCHIHYL
jgi:hypothetical protein